MGAKVYPLHTGFIRLDQGLYITGHHEDYGIEVEVPTNAFYVEADGKKIMVDTGMAETKEADWHHPGSYQPDGYRIEQRLAELGVTPEEIDAVIFTHLHWDHCANMQLFTNAEFWAHAVEEAFARDPHVLYYKSYNSPQLGATPAYDGVAINTVDGEQAFSPSVTMFPTPGHCPGHMAVEVRSEGKVIVIAGDAVFADVNLQPDEKRGLPFTPMGRYVDVFKLFSSMEQIISRADIVLTSHGMGVYDQKVWP